MKKSEIKVFALCIIESLESTDLKTGSLLKNDLLKYKKFQNPETVFRLTEVSGQEEFWAEIKTITQKVESEGWYVTIHFETHGSEQGLVLASGELIGWDELMNALRPINVILENYLVVQLAMCKGAWIISHMMPMGRAPVRGIVATMREIGERDLLSAFTAFYDCFFFELNASEAVNQMNRIFDPASPPFNLIKSEHLFDRLVNPDRDMDHFSKLIDERAALAFMTQDKTSKTSYEEHRKQAEVFLRTGFKELKKNRDFFTMKDLK